MKSSILYLIIFVAIGCSNITNSEFESVLFDEKLSRENLKKIDRRTVVDWGVDSVYASYFEYFMYKQLDGQFKPMVVNVSGDDYFALVLYTFDANGKIISQYEISGGPCGGPTELEDKIEFCPIRTSTMISPTTFVVNNIQEFYTNWEDRELKKPIEIDSTQWRIEINELGKIVEIK